MKTDLCNHQFSSLGFDVFKVTDELVEAVAAIHCKRCGMFRTKILTFRREIGAPLEDKKDSYDR